MLLGLAVACWLVIALPSALLFSRYAYGDLLETPAILTMPPFAPGTPGVWRVLGVILMLAPSPYFLATLGLVAAYWSAHGWLWGAGSFAVASIVFSRARSTAWKRRSSEIYARHLKEGSSTEDAAVIAHSAMERRRFWPPGEERGL